MKKILITGVAGMIGSHLLDALLGRGYKVVGIDNLAVGKIANIRHNLKDKNFKFMKVNILDIKDLNRAAKGIDIIIHLAAVKKIGEDGSALNTLRVNIEGTVNVFESAKKNKAKVILASTSDVYGVSEDIPFKESGNLVIGPPTAKRWAYAVSKICCEQLAMAYYKECRVPVVILRYFGCFSSRSNFGPSGGHIPVFIDAILNNKEVVIHGNGKQTRSMGYVEDAVNGTILTMENKKAVGEIFNIGNIEEMSVIDSLGLIKNTVEEIMSKKIKPKIKFIRHKKLFSDYKEIMRRLPDISKSRRVLGYKTHIRLTEGIKKVIEELS